MNQEETLAEFRDAGALLEGHFILSSGLRSPMFIQKMFIFQDPARTEKVCRALAQKAEAAFGKIDVVVSPAVGGIVPGYETARHLGAKAIFVERVEGQFELRRGFEIPENARVLMVEDIITTGLSSRECLSSLRDLGVEAVGAACLINRSGGTADLGVTLVELAAMNIPTFTSDEVPEDLKDIPAIKPGSRGLA